MNSFKDLKGESWEVPFTFREALAVKKKLGLDLAQLGESKDPEREFDALARDFERIVNVLYVCCEPQAEARGVSDLDFAGRMDFDVLTRAIDCLARALVDFFLKGPHKEKSRALMDRRAAQVEKLMETEGAKVLAALESFVSDSSLPATAESRTSAPSLSANSTG